MAIELTSETYRLTRTLPRSERYGLVQQMNRAAVSIASNIAEGAGRRDSRDPARFLRIARGSACELDAQATMAARVGVVDGESARVGASTLRNSKRHSQISRSGCLPLTGVVLRDAYDVLPPVVSRVPADPAEIRSAG